jgi:hypothetical protein
LILIGRRRYEEVPRSSNLLAGCRIDELPLQRQVFVAVAPDVELEADKDTWAL